MRLVLFRHGLAVERAKHLLLNKEDSLRPLVLKGREKTEMMAEMLKKNGADFDLIVTSPYMRATQTAEILAKSLKISNVFESAELVPSSSSLAFAQWLRIHAEECLSVLAVGHEPHMSAFASWCLTGQKESFIELKKSGALALEVESFANLAPAAAQLIWHLSPKLLQATKASLL